MRKSGWNLIHDVRLKLSALTRSQNLKARTLRSFALTFFGFGSSNFIRLASNLLLARLLFPEAFGLMAIINVVLTALELFSDTGIQASILGHKRGDERAFLDTAWTIKVVRGLILWLCACALAVPIAFLYDEPMLVQLLPVAGLNAIITGFFPTAMITANRHLKIGRMTVLSLLGQLGAVVVMFVLAWLLQSVWALLLGTLAGSLVKLVLFRKFLPGGVNRLTWDPSIAKELFGFGKWILLSTSFGFLLQNADKAILGGFVSLSMLGIYNIGYMFAQLPLKICANLRTKVLFSLYRMRPPSESMANRRKIFQVRRGLLVGFLSLNAMFGFAGIALIETLYDDRYALAGPVMVLASLGFVPRLVVDGTMELMLVHGDSRRFMYFQGIAAVVQTGLLFVGIAMFGVAGALLAPGLATLLTYPLRVYFVRPYGGWDMWGEAIAFLVGIALTGAACWIHRDALTALLAQ